MDTDTNKTPSHPFSRGAEWRKWDLHVHTPGTKKNDVYRFDNGDKWDEFCLRLETSDVQAFGITDYFSADGYINLIAEFKRRSRAARKQLLRKTERRIQSASRARAG